MRVIMRRVVLAVRLLFFLALTSSAAITYALADEPEAIKPNIVVIVGDDMGNSDVGAFGSPDIRTPNIDAIAARGIKMSTGYVTASLCLPSRAGIMTGRYPERFGVYDNPRGGGPNVGLPVAETTIAEMLKPLGYATAAIGKWHLGAHPSLHPNAAGFDLFYGFKLSLHHYFSYPGDEPIQRNGVPVPDPDYTTTGFGQEAVNFVDQHAGQPFFLYLAFNAAHGPIEALPSYLAQYQHIPDLTRREYAAVVTAMDDQIGNVLAHVDATGRPSFVVFVSDNGAPPEDGGSNLPFKGRKATMYEGGLRVPFIFRLPGNQNAGAVISTPVMTIDILPTIAALTGAPLPPQPLDGVNIVPLLTGQPQVPHQELFWKRNELEAARIDNWKLVDQGGPDMLFDLNVFPAESLNDAASNQAKSLDVRAKLEQWTATLAPPLW